MLDKETLLHKLDVLRQKREDAIAQNLEAVKDEDIELKAAHTSLRTQKKKEVAEEYFERARVEEAGMDYNRVKDLTYTAEEYAAWHLKQAEKGEKADVGFSDYSEATFRKYLKNINRIDVESIHNQKSEKEGIRRMVDDLNRQISERSKFSRRRKFIEDEDVTYINQRNYYFNKKISRAYDDYTKELRDSLERGSAQ